MAACSGKCGREGAGPAHSGDPEQDAKFTWCDWCWLDLQHKKMPPGLVRYLPPGTTVPHIPVPPPDGPQLNAMAATEHKIMPGTEVKSVATITAGPVTGNGSFTGYLAGFGRDHGGDTIMPGAMDASVKAVNEGRIIWHLTDGHSPEASAIVATVTAAGIDSRGLRIEGAWAPTQAAQALRQMAKAGHQLGLSIDYYPVAERPDGRGGRYLDEITIVGGAVTPHPMNSSALITEGKHAATVPVVDIYAGAYAESQRRDPGRERLRRMADVVSAASWPPPELAAAIGTEAAYGLIMGAAAAKAARLPAFDDGRQAERERYERDNAYSYGLAEWMAAHR